MTPIIENQEHQTLRLYDSVTGTTINIPLASEVVTLNPDTGERTFHTTTGLLRTVDGRIAPPQETYACRNCNTTPLSVHAIAYCHDCQATLCRSCAGNTPRCKTCRSRYRLKEFWSWITSL